MFGDVSRTFLLHQLRTELATARHGDDDDDNTGWCVEGCVVVERDCFCLFVCVCVCVFETVLLWIV